MKRRFISFFSLITAIFGLAVYYVTWRFLSHFEFLAAYSLIVWGMSILFIGSQLAVMTLYRVNPAFPRVLSWLFYLAQGFFLCLFFYTLSADLVTLILSAATTLDSAIVSRKALEIAAIAAVLSAIVGVLQVHFGPKLKHVSIPIKNLPPALENFRIAQISDLHVGPTIRRAYAEKVVRLANSQNPDLIALTGDFIDGVVEYLKPHVAPLANLKARHGVYFVPGNHEYYWHAPAWLAEFKNLGARVLLNEHTTILHANQAELTIAGVTDYTAGRMLAGHNSDPHKAAQGAPASSIKILLAHQPATAVEAAKAGFHLQLSGHTHGGQFFPFSIIVKMAQKYVRGLNRHDDMWVYVNSGTGYWGPPMRFLVPSEITIITLKREVL